MRRELSFGLRRTLIVCAVVFVALIALGKFLQASAHHREQTKAELRLIEDRWSGN